jgi:hypothetical protein
VERVGLTFLSNPSHPLSPSTPSQSLHVSGTFCKNGDLLSLTAATATSTPCHSALAPYHPHRSSIIANINSPHDDAADARTKTQHPAHQSQHLLVVYIPALSSQSIPSSTRHARTKLQVDAAGEWLSRDISASRSRQPTRASTQEKGRAPQKDGAHSRPWGPTRTQAPFQQARSSRSGIPLPLGNTGFLFYPHNLIAKLP